MTSRVNRKGYVVDKASVPGHELAAVRKELRVRADWDPSNSYGPPPERFTVFQEDQQSLCVPEYYGRCMFGPPARSTFRVDECPRLTFCGDLNPALKQPQAAEACSKALAETGGGVLSLSTGMGKTVIGLWLACHLKLKTLIVVNKTVLLDQWTERIRQFVPGSSIGTIQGSVCNIQDCDIVVGMLQSLSQNSYHLPGFGFLVVDECNHIGAPKFSQAMMQVNCPYKLGLSATPDRKDGLTRVIVWFLGPIFMRLERDGGMAVSVEVLDFSDCVDFSHAPPTSRGKLDFGQVVEVLCTCANRNQVLLRKLLSLPHTRHTLVLSARRPHCTVLAEMLRAAGQDAEVYLGGMSQQNLQAASQARFVVATYSMAAEGLDIPSLNTLMLATPKRDVVQACGRIMRGLGGACAPLIIDIKDSWKCTRGQFNDRRSYYERVGFVAAKTPGECMFSV